MSAYPKCSAIWQPNREVGDNGEQTVGYQRFECKVVRYFVNGKEQVLVGSRANDVC